MLFASFDSQKVADVLANASKERKAWYEGMGVSLDNYQNLESALKISGLDFEVQKKPLYFNSVAGTGTNLPPKFTKIEGQYATVRTDKNLSLGVVGDNYEILQNREAFDFLDTMCVQGAKFETAGLFRKNGAASYISMSTEPLEILGDEFNPYMMISNSHDGKGAIKVCITPIRAVCRNTAILALKRASNIVTIHHSKQMYDRLVAAREVLLANTEYMKELKITAEKLAVKPFSKENFEEMISKLYPVTSDMTDTAQVRNLAQIEKLLIAYKENDLDNFRGSAWQAIQAVSDFESHPLVFRNRNPEKGVADRGTPEFRVMFTGMPLLNKVLEYVNAHV